MTKGIIKNTMGKEEDFTVKEVFQMYIIIRKKGDNKEKEDNKWKGDKKAQQGLKEKRDKKEEAENKEMVDNKGKMYHM